MSSRIIQAAKVVTTTGPFKQEASPRLIRVVLGGSYIYGSARTQMVWEHPYFPQYYLPSDSLTNAELSSPVNPPSEHSAFTIHDIQQSGKTAARAAVARIHSGPLSGYSRLEAALMQGWFEEDEPMATKGHPLDPYKRVDTLRSSRPIRVEVDGVEIANAPWSVHLYETGLPVRYYLPRTSVNWSLLKESSTTSFCPYKGTSIYWDVVLDGGKGGRDLIWGYETTPLQTAPIQGLMCFYNEKVDIWVDGEKEARPKSKFA